MTDDAPHMWNYWKDKYGTVDALHEHYSNLLAGDEMLQTFVAQYEAAHFALNARVEALLSRLPQEDV